MPDMHRIERLTHTIAGRIQERVDSLAMGLKGDSKRPPFTVRLTEDEQLEMYFAMDEQKWQQMVQERGLDKATDYSLAMQKLVEKKLGPSEPTTIMLAPQQFGALGEGPQPMQPQPMQQPMGQTMGQMDMAALTGGMQPDESTPGAQAAIQQALSSVGLDPSQVGF